VKRLLIAVYPEAWRRRYAEEMSALLEDDPPGLRAAFDLLRDALSAHLRGAPGIAPLERARNSISGVLASFLCFAFVAAAFSQTTEDPPFRVAGQNHPLLAVTRDAFLISATASLAALLAAALPLAVRVLGETWRTRRHDLIGLVALPPLAIGVLAASLGLASIWFASHPQSVDAFGIALSVVLGVIAASAAAFCWVAPRALLRRIEAGRRALSLAVPAAVAVSVCMALATVATTAYLLAILADAPVLAGSSDGPGGISITDVDIAIQLVMMLALTATAMLSALRGARAMLSR
jgi:hypothetical protein